MNGTPRVTSVVGWDGSLESQTALDWAVRRSRLHDGDVHVVSVLEPFPLLHLRSMTGQDSTASAAASVDDAVELIRARMPELRITSELATGDPADLLIAHSSPDSLLVFGTRHRSAPYFRFAWSFGGRLARRARGPVVVVPENRPVDGRGIVVGVDGSAESDQAVRAAAREARLTRAPLTIVHCWLGPSASPVPGPFVEKPPWLVEAHERILAAAILLARQTAPSLEVEAQVDMDTAAHALLSRAHSAGMVVVGARGRSPLSALALGSVSTALLEEMPCPVMMLGPESVPVADLAAHAVGTDAVGADAVEADAATVAAAGAAR